MRFDIVIPWVDWSSLELRKNMVENGGFAEGIVSSDSNKYQELKYLLRSIIKHNVQFRKIFIVHSDFNDPPPYLKTNHTSLHFVKHSQIVTDPSHLPLIHRETININFINIPGLSRYFVYFEDDYLMMSPQLVENEIKRHFRKEILIFKHDLVKCLKQRNIEKAYRLWFNTSLNSERVVTDSSHNCCQENIGTITCEHFIRFYDCEIIKQIEERYPVQFKTTRQYHMYKLDEPNVVCLNCMYVQFLINKLGYKEVYPKKELNLIYCKRKDTIEENIQYLKKELAKDDYEMFCIQEYGISDERQRQHQLFNTYLQWITEYLPDKSDFEI